MRTLLAVCMVVEAISATDLRTLLVSSPLAQRCRVEWNKVALSPMLEISLRPVVLYFGGDSKWREVQQGELDLQCLRPHLLQLRWHLTLEQMDWWSSEQVSQCEVLTGQPHLPSVRCYGLSSKYRSLY